MLDLLPDGAITLTERVPSDDPTSRPPNGSAPDDTAGQQLDRLRQGLVRLRLDPLRRVLQGAEPAGPPASYRAPATRRTLLAPASGATPAWLAVGAALVQTPPWLGQGVAQAREQADALACAWASAAPPCRTGRIRERLDQLSARQLQAAALAAWAEGDALAPA